MSFLEVLLIIFIVLKLVGVITWSWWLVTAPFWIPVAIFLVIALVILLMGGTIKVTDKSKR